MVLEISFYIVDNASRVRVCLKNLYNCREAKWIELFSAKKLAVIALGAYNEALW